MVVTPNSQFIEALLHHVEEKPIKAFPHSPSVGARQTCKQEAMPHISEKISPKVKYEGEALYLGVYCIEMHLHQANDGQFQANFIGEIIFFISKPSGLGSSGLKQHQLSWIFLDWFICCRCGYPLLLQGPRQGSPQ